MARLLLGAGVDPDRTPTGKTPLMDAVDEHWRLFTAERLELVHLLLAHGADPNRRGPNGWRPLHYAVRGGPEPVRALLAHGADPSAAAHGGLLARDLAKGRVARNVLALLEERRAA
jgi:ankyrin repeat protein